MCDIRAQASCRDAHGPTRIDRAYTATPSDYEINQHCYRRRGRTIEHRPGATSAMASHTPDEALPHGSTLRRASDEQPPPLVPPTFPAARSRQSAKCGGCASEVEEATGAAAQEALPGVEEAESRNRAAHRDAAASDTCSAS